MFTIGTSIASVATAWIGVCILIVCVLDFDFEIVLFECDYLMGGTGYSIRHHHQSKVDQRLESIEKAVSICCILFITFIVSC